MRFPLIPLAIALSGGLSVVKAEPEPIVHMLVPGFTVRELPVRLSNINNLRFAPDGRLLALGYDGRIHALRDTNGDGLEDKDELFWDKQTLIVPVGMVWSKDGLYVSSHRKISLLRDTDGDGKADTEEVIASGWPPTDVGSGSVDTTAVTLDKQGNVYFGLSTPDYSNPYRVKDGVSHYDVNGVRGTIQKWSMKTKQLETIATGIRIPYTLAFNRNGDLFLSDQEGETWCPNGNPLDELNHIIPGRNYGFPPRHEKYLPNLVSEPPVVAFGPQHQSTCGFAFNEPKKGQGLFGPKWWEGDAFVAGESRGKIWRVKLVKTPHGYVGKEFIIARLSMLTTDVTISPKGDLYVSCHSGPPDWGTGPQGEGKIFKISYTDLKAPQPVFVGATDSTELRVAFDRPIDPYVTNDPSRIQIEFGDYVSAADRYEVLKPPYQIVKFQESTPRGRLKVVSAHLDKDLQTLVLSTDPHPQAVRYALTIPGIKRRGEAGAGATMDLAYDLSGASAQIGRLPPTSKRPLTWSGWMPSADRLAANALGGSAPPWTKVKFEKGDSFLAVFRLNLPLKDLVVHARASQPVEIGQSFSPTKRQEFKPHQEATGKYSVAVPINSDQPTFPAPGTIAVSVDGDGHDLELSYSYGHDPGERPFGPGQLLVPWFHGEFGRPTISSAEVAALADDKTLQLAGGDYERGRGLFFGDKLKCANCHRIRSEGQTLGPDLSNLVARDAASVLRDIKEPSASINPDYVAYNVALRDGGELTGFVRAQSETTLQLVGADGKESGFPRSDLRELRPSSISLMPAGLLDALKEEPIRDLLTFLLNEPPKRSKAEVDRLLNTKQETRDTFENPKPDIGNQKLQIVLVASKQDHGPGQHDYPAWQKKWRGLLGQAANVTVTDAWEWPTEEQFQNANVLVFYFWNHDWSAERYRQLDEYLARGGGVVLLHAATIADKEPEQLAERIGLAAQPGPTKYLHTPFDLKFVAPTNNPITHGLPPQIRFLDEPYWPMFGDTNKIEVLATTEQEGKSWPMIWTFQKGKGRVFASILGHYSWTLDDPLFRILICRGIGWAAGEPPTRFDKPATAGKALD